MKLDIQRVEKWESWMKSNLLNTFSGENFKVFLESPLFIALLKNSEVEKNWMPKWEVEDMIEHINNIPSECICRAIIKDEKYRTPKIINAFLELDVGGVTNWSILMKIDLLKAFNGGNFENFSKSELFEILLKDEGIRKSWTPKWKVEDVIKYIEKIPSECIARAIIADKKYCTTQIINKLNPAKVKTWNEILQSELLNALNDCYSFDKLPIPLQVVLSWEWIKIEEKWTPQWKVEDMIENINEIPTECTCRAIIKDDKYRIPEIAYKLDPDGVKFWSIDMKVKFLRIFSKSFDDLPVSLQVVLSWEWIKIRENWIPRLNTDDFIQYINEIPPRYIVRRLIDDEKYLTNEVLRKLTVSQVKEWTPEKKDSLQQILRSEHIASMSNEVVTEFWKK